MPLKDQYMTISQAAKHLGVTRQTVSRWINAGDISAEKVGREKLIPKGEVYSSILVGDAIRFVPRMWDALERFLGSRIEKIILEPYPIPEMEFTRAVAIGKRGGVNYVEIWDKGKYTGERDSYQFRKLKKSDWSPQESIQPYAEMYIGVSKEGRVVAIYRRGDKALNKRGMAL
jgi:excisionase family DNA binding protein